MPYVVRVDMTGKRVWTESCPQDWAQLGGRALTSTIVATEVPPGADPLGPSNRLVLAPGLLAGTALSSSGRLSVGGKSPLTAGIKEANAGGTAGHKLAQQGIKAVVVEGAAEPGECWVLVVGDEARLQPAPQLAGLGVYETLSTLRDTFGERSAAVCIGPAGELRMRGAAVAVSDLGFRPRFAARGGLGALMGSRGLKAVVVLDGSGDAHGGGSQEFAQLARSFNQALLSDPKTGQVYPKYGTASIVRAVDACGALPTNNFSRGQCEAVEELSGERMADLIAERGGEGKTGIPCMPRCVIRCGNVFPDGRGRMLVSNLQYETIALLGSNCGMGNLDAVARLNYLCNDLGLDTIETGAALAVVMEAGALPFGHVQEAAALIGGLARGEAAARLVASGAAVAGAAYGVARVPVARGQAMPGYDPRAMKGNGVTYATSPMGADHTAGNAFGSRGRVNQLLAEGQVELSRDLQITAMIIDTLGLCLFARPPLVANPGLAADLLRALYRWQVTPEELGDLALSVLRLERGFNERAEPGVQWDRLPEYFYREALPPYGVVFDIDESAMAEVWR
ncbi:MAG: aldehyde ferredoxin oxidoreductase C-terminal domain-containing protein [Bacillota bacterium]|nr:aldehyde ferredoxin oxidoreductase C-terminal domain-containing protein [Bacillota bacterium]